MPAPRAEESLLINFLPQLAPAARVLCTSTGRAQFARAAAQWQLAALNQVTNLIAETTATGPTLGLDEFSHVLANPRYYANFRIAERFLDIAAQALRRGGELLLVTKFRDWYDENLCRWFRSFELVQAKDYCLVRARKA